MLKRVAIKGAMALAVSAALISGVQAADTIKIGSFLAVTGPASFLGDPELKTLQMYVDKINAEGGLLGKQVELVHYDTAGNAQKARTFVKRLIESDNVDLIVGGSTSGATLAVIPLVESAKVPFISLAGAVAIVDPVKKWVFKTPHTDRMAAEKIFEDMKSRGFKKVALISGTGGFGRSGRAQATQVIGKYGLELVADETYGPKDTDMTAQLTKIKSTAGVDAILNFGFGQGPAIVTKNYKQLGIDLPLYQSHGVASKKFIELAGNASEGVRLPAAALLLAEQLPDSSAQKPVVVKYKTEYEQKYNSEVSTFGGHAYDGLMLAVNAIKKAGSTDKEKVRAAIESTKNYVGTGGVVNMSAEDHLGLDLSAFKILEIRNGDWTLVK
ncbi:amino acid/amide ABC transporter substrate-binding protein, HAAT family (TC 3.A.1.4.-) [Oceanospirillum multiglobuliferum]|uniref:ABC transporter substrate-binding protein n=1 Tax=Oceanospirillum multiglobuliferum TaxID=64969 RepID=A0A1T4RWV4_9GAMM|nr:ABC transporter substrate-binding protein [Oceanospirillum multiglobuliferum]OPX54583.1 ABC transporter substrate-binding protein [Oceanospirillum multiglobuliferum]SKA20484.1 amino acid/amide ABC transporter substrate-binding protein, HAAT family (TC 3.A.1.4.-) [Oceanospirillum multiglobuliferum]